MANQEVKRLFFVCDGWDERDGDDRLFYMLLRYHLRGLINAPAWVDRADFSVEIVAEKVLTSALTVVIYSAGEPDCERHLTPSFDALMNKIVNVETAKDE